MIPPPPQGYKLVTNKEIPIVPNGAMFYSYDKWMNSLKVGDKPCDDFQYAIPAPIPAPEPQAELIAKSQDELIATQRRVIEILEANLEKSEARIAKLHQDRDEMIGVIAQQQSEINARHVADDLATTQQSLANLWDFVHAINNRITLSPR